MTLNVLKFMCLEVLGIVLLKIKAMDTHEELSNYADNKWDTLTPNERMWLNKRFNGDWE